MAVILSFPIHHLAEMEEDLLHDISPLDEADLIPGGHGDVAPDVDGVEEKEETLASIFVGDATRRFAPLVW